MLYRKTLLLLLLAWAALPAAYAEQPAQQISLKAFEVVEIGPDTGRAPTRLQIQAFGRTFELALSPNEGLLSALPARQRNRIPADDLFLKGTLSGVPGSWVRLNRIDRQFSGALFDGSELYLIDRVSGFSGPGIAATSPDQTIVFRLGDLDFPYLVDHGGIDPSAGISDGEPVFGSSAYREFVGHLREVAVLQGTAMLAMPVTVVSDVQFSGRHGSSAASVVAGRINFIDGIYANQLGVGIMLWHHEILSTNGPLTATGALDLLNQFRAFMTTGSGSAIPFEGLAHLFTRGRPQGGVAGIAYLGVLCFRPFGYGIDEDLNNETTSALIFAHEVGHNFNAPHDGDSDGACGDETFRGIMNPSINGSQQFSDCSLAEMTAEVGGANCLVDVFANELVFDNGFE